MTGLAIATLGVAGVLVAPAFGAVDQPPARGSAKGTMRSPGGFTPAAGDPRLAALLARGGFDAGTFRFTPAEARRESRAVTVAVRARTISGDAARAGANDAAAGTGIAPIAYNLGVAVGWKRFALAGDIARVDMAGQPGGRESADVAVSYTAPRWSGRVKAEAARPADGVPQLVADLPSYSVDLGGSYRLTGNLDVTAGVRYRADRDRLSRFDQRRDSQAVYLGTAFRF